jgi:hypothetical protein
MYMWRLCEVFFVRAIQLYTMRRALSKAVHRIIHTFGHTLPVTKGIKKKLTRQIGHLVKHLGNGWRKRQVTLVVSHKAFLDVLITLESLMGTAHGAEDLGRCSHGLACPGRGLGPVHRVLPRIWPYLAKKKSKVVRPAKRFCYAHNFVTQRYFDKQICAG